jgi:hypothetical protein
MLEVKCASSNNWAVLRYTEAEIDVMAIYNSNNKDIYFIPMSKMNRGSLNLRLEQSKNNQKLKVHPALDYRDLKL